MNDNADKVAVVLALPTAEDFIQGCRYLLYVLYGDSEEGVRPDPFTESVIRALELADDNQLSALSLGFPALVTMFNVKPQDQNALRERVLLLSPLLDEQGTEKKEETNG